MIRAALLIACTAALAFSQGRLRINNDDLPDGRVGTPYLTTISAQGGTGLRTWRVTEGELPPGLLFVELTGTIAGIPTTRGSYSFTVEVRDLTDSADRQFRIVITGNNPPSVQTSTLPNGTVGSTYAATLAATGGAPPYTWAVSAGSLPAGLGLASNGAISGTPTTAGTSTFTARVTDSANQSATRDLQIAIVAGAPTVTTTSLPGGSVGQPYSASLGATGGTPPYNWAVSAGSLPAGLTLASNGAISGTPTTAGTSSFTARVTDAANQSATRDLQITIAAGAPTITTTSLASGSVGQPYSSSLSATGGTPPYSWAVAAGSLPAGLTLASNGAVTGTPTTAGTSSFTARVTDAANQSATRDLQITIAAGAPTITTTSLASGSVGQPYSASLGATGGTPPYNWAVSAGILPAGLTLASNGAISGTPTTAGTSSFTARVTDAANQSATRDLQITIAAGAPTITTTSLVSGSVGQPYSATLSATGGTPPYNWAVSAGALPAGLTLASNGAIAGTPTTAGTSTFTARVTDAANRSATRDLQITITAGAPTITTSSLSGGTVGQPYSASLAAGGGTPPYAWAVSAGSLPAGLTLASNGAITGTPTTAGASSFTARVTDAANQSATRDLQITITAPPAPTVVTTSLSGGTVGQGYSASLSATGGTPPYSWSVSAGSLPAGLTLASNGSISGTPTTAGTSTFTARVTDAANQSATRSLQIAIAAAPTPPTVVTTSLPNATVGVEFAQTLSATGGRAPYSWSVASGAIPPGLSLDPAGRLAGVPSNAGSYSFTIRVTDADSRTGERPFTMSVAPALSISSCPTGTGLVGTNYQASLAAAGGAAPYSWSVTSGQLPPGLTLSPAGSLSGNPILAGAFNFTLNVSDASSRTATRACSIAIASPLLIQTEALPDATTTARYFFTLRATGGTAPYLWTTSGGALPPGIFLDPNTGTLSGQPTQAGPYTVALRVTDGSGGAASRTYTIAVVTGLAIPSCPTVIATVGRPYDATVTALGGQAPYTWGVSSGSLPTGLTIASDSGIVSGVPASAGSATFALRVSDQSGASAERACSIQVAPELVITTSSLPPAQVGTPYTAPLTATGGVPPLTWSITGGALPSGLTLNSATGQISGTASAAGIFRITVQVSDSAGNQRERQLELTVGAGFTITACPDPSAVIGAPYSSSPSIVGGDAPVTWAIVTGSLPGGLTLDGQTGSIAGTATTAGTTDFSLRATDAASRTATRACSINVNPSALRISSNGRLRDAILGTAFSETLQVSGGRGPFTWSLAAGSLPPGVVLGSNGQLTGTPTVAGVYSFTARVTDADRSAATAALELRVIPAPSPTVSFGDLPDIIAPAQQPRVRVSIASPYPTALRGRLVLRFTPDPGLNVDDPAVAFVDGSRAMTFEIPAGATEAVFPVPQNALQTGSVAGVIELEVTLASGDFDVTPTPAPVKAVRVDRTAPVITSVRVAQTTGGFEVIVVGLSTTREVTGATFQFTPAAGSRLDASQVTVSTEAAARQWFADGQSRQFGGQFTFTQPFTVQNVTLFEVTVTLTNGQGTSQPARARF